MYPATLSYDEIAARRRKNILKATLGLIGITVLLLTAWIYFKELDPGTPLLNNVVVFALVNLNVILLMALALMVVRNLIRLFYAARTGPGGARPPPPLLPPSVGFSPLPPLPPGLGGPPGARPPAPCPGSLPGPGRCRSRADPRAAPRPLPCGRL